MKTGGANIPLNTLKTITKAITLDENNSSENQQSNSKR